LFCATHAYLDAERIGKFPISHDIRSQDPARDERFKSRSQSKSPPRSLFFPCGAPPLLTCIANAISPSRWRGGLGADIGSSIRHSIGGGPESVPKAHGQKGSPRRQRGDPLRFAEPGSRSSDQL
jgi:hypothetical protein